MVLLGLERLFSSAYGLEMNLLFDLTYVVPLVPFYAPPQTKTQTLDVHSLHTLEKIYLILSHNV